MGKRRRYKDVVCAISVYSMSIFFLLMMFRLGRIEHAAITLQEIKLITIYFVLLMISSIVFIYTGGGEDGQAD